VSIAKDFAPKFLNLMFYLDGLNPLPNWVFEVVAFWGKYLFKY